jgi:hypothetical protein
MHGEISLFSEKSEMGMSGKAERAIAIRRAIVQFNCAIPAYCTLVQHIPIKPRVSAHFPSFQYTKV